MDSDNGGTSAASSVITSADDVSSLNPPPSHHVLEITLLSAQDLAPISKSLRAYALIWIHPNRKRTTTVDHRGHTSPTWNSNFSFKVDREFLESDQSAVSVEIYTVSWFRDVLVGTVAVNLRNLFSPPSANGKRSVALQIRRPSGSPQGMLNIEVALLDSAPFRGIPLADVTSTSSNNRKALEFDRRNGLEHEIGEEDDERQRIGAKIHQWRRSMSVDMSDLNCEDFPENSGSICNGSTVNGGSEVCSDVGPSASIVAAEIARDRQRLTETREKGVGDSMVQAAEEAGGRGFRTKMERWRRETTAEEKDEVDMMIARSGHRRRNSDSGVYSCFVYGFQFTIVCGTKNKKSVTDEINYCD